MLKGQRVDIAGQRFGSLVAVEFAGSVGRRASAWTCRCDCGRPVVVRVGNLRSGHTRSCGCLKIAASSTHGQSRKRTREYRSWQNMKRRCSDPKMKTWAAYGGRGIRVCAEWLGDGGFERFFEHIGRAPSMEHTLDRIDGDKNYEPGNVRWATRQEQDRNRRDNRQFTLDGETLTAAEWARRAGVSRQTLVWRVEMGWPLHEALTAPPQTTRAASGKDAA